MKLTRLMLLLSLALVGHAELWGQGLNNRMDSISYALGMDLGRNIGNLEGVELRSEMLYQGMKDALEGAESQLTDQEMQAFLQAFQEEARRAQQEAQQAKAAEAKAEGEAFLAENQEKENIMTTESGLQYEVLTEGSGASPTAENVVKVNYEGKLLNGEVFDSSYERGEPVEFPLGRVIPGWTEGLQLMKEIGRASCRERV
jgi:FKBP-type peptidyl-prolyl cis-trans isomerase FklB